VLKTSQPQPVKNRVNPATSGKMKRKPSTNGEQRIQARDNVKQILIGHIYNTDVDCSKSEENTLENGKLKYESS
jgi:hypothetical protein